MENKVIKNMEYFKKKNNIPGIDPEVNQYGTGNALGLDYFTNPQTQSTLLGVTFNF